MAAAMGRRCQPRPTKYQREDRGHKRSLVDRVARARLISIPILIPFLFSRNAISSPTTTACAGKIQPPEPSRSREAGRRFVSWRRLYQTPTAPEAILPRLSRELGALPAGVLGKGKRAARAAAPADAGPPEALGSRRGQVALVERLAEKRNGSVIIIILTTRDIRKRSHRRRRRGEKTPPET